MCALSHRMAGVTRLCLSTALVASMWHGAVGVCLCACVHVYVCLCACSFVLTIVCVPVARSPKHLDMTTATALPTHTRTHSKT